MASRFTEGRARLVNVGLLIGGYGIGQGAIFLAQTWLLMHGRLELLALFGTHFAFSVLGILVVEAGSLTTLARHAASLERGAESARAMWQVFWETSLVRAGLAVAVLAAGALATAWAASPFTSAYALCAAPAFALWAVSASGVLDGLRLSGIGGLAGSLAYATPALALVFAPGLAPETAGTLLGGAFSAGYLLTVLVQFAALRASGWRAQFVRPTRNGVTAAARDGVTLLGGTLPGQLYFRVQLLMCSAWLGPGATALLVYVKQIVNAATQVIGFVRRVEFPTLVRELALETNTPVSTIWRQQVGGTRLAVSATLCLALAGLAAVALTDGLAADVGAFLAVYSVAVGVSAVALGFTQGLAALGRYRELVLRSVLSVALGLAASVVLVRTIGIYGFAFADVIASAFVVAITVTLLRRDR
jgi:hypothetical protein